MAYGISGKYVGPHRHTYTHSETNTQYERMNAATTRYRDSDNTSEPQGRSVQSTSSSMTDGKHPSWGRDSLSVTAEMRSQWVQEALSTDWASVENVLATAQEATVQERALRPWPTEPYTAPPHWDCRVHGHRQELQARGHVISPFIPALTPTELRPDGIKPEAWRIMFDGHPQHQFLATGAQFGFPLLTAMTPRRVVHKDPAFTPDVQRQVDEWLSEQLVAGNMTDITADFNKQHDLWCVVSPTTTAPKAAPVDASGRPTGPASIRVCHNLSKSGAGSVNAHTLNDRLEPLDLLAMGDVVKHIRFLKRARPGAKVQACRLDWKAAYRQFPVRLADRWLLGQPMRTLKLIHKVLSWGHSSAAHTVQAISSAICDIMQQRGYWVKSFLDDFVIIAYDHTITEVVAALRAVMSELGLHENVDKFVPPTHQLVILGVRFDFDTMVTGFDDTKRLKLLDTLQQWITSPSSIVTVHDVQRITGKLAFFAPIVPFARRYIFPFWRACAAVNNRAWAAVALEVEVLNAAQWWVHTLSTHPTYRISIAVGLRSPIRVISGKGSDSSLTNGYGATDAESKRYIRGVWTSWQKQHWSNNALELTAILFACATFGAQYTGCIVAFDSDNTTAVAAVQNCGCDNPLLRFITSLLVDVQLYFRFVVAAQHQPGATLIGPDLLSRGHDPASALRKAGHTSVESWSECEIPSSLNALGSHEWLHSSVSSQELHASRPQEPTTGITSWLADLAARTPDSTSAELPWFPFLDTRL